MVVLLLTVHAFPLPGSKIEVALAHFIDRQRTTPEISPATVTRAALSNRKRCIPFERSPIGFAGTHLERT
jgi:hypothetical protein